MPNIKGKTALVTGASSGIGESTVERLLVEGVTVYAAARRVEKMQNLESKGAKVIALDITEHTSIRNCVNRVLQEQGCIDILVNNAGYGSYGAIEDVPMDEARRQFEVNIFGLAHLTQSVLPYMREKQYGKIVNVSSIGGKLYSSFGGWYHATKHALEGLSDCLRLETQPFGVDVIIIEPGGIDTEWGQVAADHLSKTSFNGVYKLRARKKANDLEALYKSGKMPPPELIAKVIVKALRASRPKTRYSAGYMAKPGLWARRWLSDHMFDRIVAAAF